MVGKIVERAFVFIRPSARDGRPTFDPGHNRYVVTFHTYTLYSNTTLGSYYIIETHDDEWRIKIEFRVDYFFAVSRS